MGVHRVPRRDHLLRTAHNASLQFRGEAERQIQQDLRVLCGLVHTPARRDKSRYDNRPDAGHRHPAADAELRRLIFVGVFYLDFCIFTS